MTRDVLCLAGGALLAGALLLVGGRSLSFDELFAAHAASLPIRDLLRFTYLHDAHPPLYYLLLRAWISLFGSGEVVLRALSALAGLGTVGAVARLGAEISPGAGQAAALWLFGSPLFLYASVEATRYALLVALFALAALAVWRMTSDPGRRPWILGVLLGALLYTHYLGAVFCAALGGFVLRCGSPQARLRFFLASALAGLAFLPWLPVLWHHVLDGRINPPWRGPLPATLPLQILHLVGFGGRAFGSASPYLHPTADLTTQLLLALPVVGAIWLGGSAVVRGDRRLGALLGWCVGLPAAVLLGVSLWTRSLVAYPRYFVFALPFWAVAAGAAVAELGRAPARRRAAGAVAFGILFVLSLASLAAFAASPTAGTGDRKSMGAYLRAHVRADDAVVVFPSWERLGLAYYAPGVRAEWAFLGTRRDAPDPGEVRMGMTALAARRKRIWVLEEPPMPPGLFDATYRWLARTHRVRDHREFGGVRVTLFVRGEGGR
ncbi:MAG: glycosyltransferase family 39 protein [Armatimonadota bacterium]|nr:glycosyltransferase family 39 protein [Armatimonadota bacterium]MDR7444213.1 glycosyltransferase family 39 protein [Armatimonadota bacterium]MDR7570577.1 glycosyltransferase family 39 protein [Armatimonadota bacterium]MDR7614252.1 glycosyltransferase family 39 protein [Armatimonadota bacterium]